MHCQPAKARTLRWGWSAAWLACLCLAGCQQANTYVEPPPPEVTVALPVERDVTSYTEVTGTAQPVTTVDIRARVKGFLKERHFQEGSHVKQGQLLLVIDEEPFQLQLDRAKTQLAEAETALKKARHAMTREVARAQQSLDEAQLLLARLDESRIRTLMSRGATTRDEMDRTEANLKKAEAQFAASKANREQAEADYETNILAAQATMLGARTAVRNAEIELGYCRMTSPIDGRISRVNQDVGNLVGDNQSTLLATVVKLDPIYAYTNVSEYDLLRYRDRPNGAESQVESKVPMEMGMANEDGYPHRGRVDYQDPRVDADTGTVRVRGIFDNPDGAILPGLFVRLRVPRETKQRALLVPERALGIDQSGQYLLVVGADDVVEYRPVQVGTLVDGMRVVEGKIGPQDRVVVDGLLRARPKLKVSPKHDGAGAKVAGQAATVRTASSAAQH